MNYIRTKAHRKLMSEIKLNNNPLKGKPSHKKGIYKIKISKQELQKLYHLEKKSLKDIANKYDVNAVTILNYMKRFKIPRRDINGPETRKLCAIKAKGRIISEAQRKQQSITVKKLWDNGTYKRSWTWSKESRIKITGKNNRMYGKHLTAEHKLKLSIAGKNKQVGSKHPNWQGGRSFEPYNLNFNAKFKEMIKERDGHKCMICMIPEQNLKYNLCIHHIDYGKENSIPQNCVSLCRKCHSKTGYNRKSWILFFHSLLSECYNYEYINNKAIITIIRSDS